MAYLAVIGQLPPDHIPPGHLPPLATYPQDIYPRSLGLGLECPWGVYDRMYVTGSKCPETHISLPLFYTI